MIVSLEAQSAVPRQKIFDIEIADKRGLRNAAVAIAEITVDNQPVVEQLRRQGQIHLHIREVVSVRFKGWIERHLVGDL